MSERSKESTGFSLVFLQCMLTIFGLSIFLIIRNESSDQFYGFLVLLFAGISLVGLPRLKIFKIRSSKLGNSDFIRGRSLILFLVFLSFILSQSYIKFLFSLLLLTLLNVLFMKNSEILSTIKRINIKGKYLAWTLFVVSLFAFLIDLLKTPSSLQDTNHPTYVGDEIQAPTAGLHNWRTYSAQYTALLGYLAKPFLNKQSPVDLQSSTYTFLIVVQYIAVGILFLLIFNVAGRNNFKWPFIFAFAVLSGSFFYAFGVMDWLQNFPARTLFPIITIYLYFSFLKFNSLSKSGTLLEQIKEKSLIALVGILAAIGFVNDLMFGAPVVLGIVISIVFSKLPLSTKIRFIFLYIITFTYTAVLLNLYVLRTPDSQFSLGLLTHYMVSYGENGFARLFDFRGIEIFFWGFGLAAIIVARRRFSAFQDEHAEKVLHPMLLLCATLIFSTVPYTTGRSFSAQIWASCAIYVIVLFACLFRLFRDYEVGMPLQIALLPDSNVLISVAILFSIFSGILNPMQIGKELKRIDSLHKMIPSGTQLNLEADKILAVVRTEGIDVNEVALLVPHGNNMAITLGIRNGLFVNHPTSVIFVEQMNLICQRNYDFGVKRLIFDTYLEPLFRDSEKCITYFGKVQKMTSRIYVTQQQ